MKINIEQSQLVKNLQEHLYVLQLVAGIHKLVKSDQKLRMNIYLILTAFVNSSSASNGFPIFCNGHNGKNS